MRVAFTPEALNDPASARFLTAIWWLTEDRRHTWLVPDLNAVQTSSWLGHHGGTLASAVRASAQMGARLPHLAQVWVEPARHQPVHRANAWHIGAHRAAAWLRRPAVVVVENGRVDGSFLRVVALRIGERRLRRELGDDHFEGLRARWRSPTGDGELIEVRHGGGSTTSMVIELVLEADPTLPPRLVVMVDSDRSAPGAPLGSTAQQVQQTCGAAPHFGCGWRPGQWISTKREVENYLPHGAITRVVRKGLPGGIDPDFGDLKTVRADLARRVLEEADLELHERALRERCGDKGKELDELVKLVIAAL